MTTRMVLVPGFWLGAWAWDEVIPALNADIDAVAVDLPGQDGKPSEAPAQVSLADQVAAIERALEAEPADRRILVVHSGSANPGTMLLDKRPELVDHIVFVDTAPPVDGLAFNADATSDATLDEMLANEHEQASFRDLTDEQLERFKQRATVQPKSLVTEAVTLTNDARHNVPVTVICSCYTAEQFQDFADQGIPYLAALNDYESVHYIDLPTGHWPMWSKPAELAALLNEVAVDD